jgi:NitT/TauT family transport system permease protein
MAETAAASVGARFGRAVGDVLLPVAAAALVWTLAVHVFRVSPWYLPPLEKVLATIVAQRDSFIASFLRTLAETLLGFGFGAVIGIASGVLFERARRLRELLFPIFVVSQTVPVVAFGALVVLWFGNTIFAKVVIAFYLTFFPVTVNALRGLASVDPRQVALLRSFGASNRQVFWKLKFPGALPYIFVALRLGAGLSLIGAMVGEWFGDTTGLGVLLLHAMFNENIVLLWAAILCTALLGTLLYALIAAIESRLVFWRSEL